MRSGHCYLDRPRGGVVRHLHVELEGADVVDRRQPAVDGHGDSIQQGGQLAAENFAVQPQARGICQVRAEDGNPGAGGNALLVARTVGNRRNLRGG